MKVIYGLNNLKSQKKGTVVTIGIFDGVHMGHQKILKETVRQAKTEGLTAAVVTFHPHPQKILGGAPFKSTIISLEHRLKLLQDSGIGLCVIVKFTPAFSKKSIDWFIKRVLVNKLKAETLAVGSGFKIGKEAMPAEKLKNILASDGLSFKIIPAQKYKGKVISSSLIRSLIEKGRLGEASKLLGKSVTVYGTVISGKRRGRTLGFRTANIDPHHEVIPPSGVYAVRVRIDKKYYKGVLNIGFRPTFRLREKEPTTEVHIIGFNASLYNKRIELFFIKKIRSEKHFKSRETLRAQIARDILAARH